MFTEDRQEEIDQWLPAVFAMKLFEDTIQGILQNLPSDAWCEEYLRPLC